MLLGAPDDGADDGVETGAVASAGQHGDSHGVGRSLARPAASAKGLAELARGSGPSLGQPRDGQPGSVPGEGGGAEQHRREPDRVREQQVDQLHPHRREQHQIDQSRR